MDGEILTDGDNDFLLSLADDANITDKNLRKFLSTWDGTGDIAQKYNEYLNSASTSTSAFGATLKTVAANMGIMLAVSLGVNLLGKAIDAMVETDEERLDLAEKANANIKEINDSYTSHKKVVDDCAATYDKLSKGVNTFTNENINLSTEDYEKYLDINDQFAEAFPELITGFDEQGNAILSIGTSAFSSRKELEELIKKEQEAANLKIAENIDDSFAGVAVNLKYTNDEIKKYKDELDSANEGVSNVDSLNDTLINYKQDDVNFEIDFSKKGSLEYARLLEGVLNDMELLNEETYGVPQDNGEQVSYLYNLSSLTDEQLSEVKENVRKQVNVIKTTFSDEVELAAKSLEEQKRTLDLTWTDFIPSLLSGTHAIPSFNELTPELQNAANGMINHLDIGQADVIDSDYNKVADYIRAQIIVPLQTAEPEVQRAYSKLFSLNPNDFDSFDSYEEKLNELVAKIAGEDGQKQLDFKAKYNLDELDDVKRQIDSISSGSVELEPITFDQSSFSKTASRLSKITSLYSKFRSKIDNGESITFDISEIEGLRDSLVKTDKQLGVTGEQFNQFESVLSSPESTIDDMQNAIDEFSTRLIYQSGCLNGLNTSNRDLIVSQLELQGITNASAVVSEDLALASEVLAASGYSLTNATDAAYWALLDECGASEVVKASLYQLNAAEIAYNSTGLTTQQKIDALGRLAEAYGDTISHAAAAAAAARVLVEDITYEDALDDLMAQMMQASSNVEIVLPKVRVGGGGGRASSGGQNKASEKEDKAKKDQIKEYDWVKRAVDAANSARENIIKTTEDETKSYQEQISAMDMLIRADQDLIDTNSYAVDKYLAEWKQAKEDLKTLFGDEIAGDLIKKIIEGSFDIDEIKVVDDEDAAQANGDTIMTQAQIDGIDKAVSKFDQYSDAEDDFSKAMEQKTEDINKQFELRIKEIEAYIDIASGELSKAQSDLKIKEITGREITGSDYRDLIDLADEQIDFYEQKIDALEEQMDDLDEDDEKYISLQSSISSCEQAINQCRENQAEWNEEIRNIPIRKIDRFLELLKNVKQDLANYIDEQSSVGVDATKDQFQSLIDISQRQIAKLLEQQKLLRDKLSAYDVNSDKYNETQNEIQDIDDEISSLIQSQNDWNQSILNIPVDSIGKCSEDLQSIADSLGDILSEYDTAIGAVTNAIDREIESVNDLKEAAQEEYESGIKGYQDKLDLLQKQNKERQIELALEQAQYDLDRARNQRTNAVIRDGEKVYEADQEAVRGAQEAKHNAEYNKVIQELQNQISDLEEKRDDILEGYDDQIEKLDEIKERWSSITDDIQQAADSMKAADILGSGWQDKILAGDDGELYESVKNMYANLFNQKDQYERQIASNERLTEMMGKYIELWAEGTLSFESVSSSVRDLIDKMQDGFTSLDNLNSLTGIHGGGDLSSILAGIQGSVSAAAGQFDGYFNIAQSNNRLISQYTSSWEEMRENLRQQIAALESTAESVKSTAGSLKILVSKYSRDRDHDRSDNRSDRKKSDKNSPPHNDDQDPDNGPGKNISSKHNGVLSGYVGDNKSTSARERLDALKYLATKDLKQDEYPLVALGNELVFTEEQQRQLLENFMSMPADGPTYRRPGYRESTERTTSQVFNFSMGDIHLPNVKDPDGFVKFLDRNFEAAMRQNFSKVFRH